MACARSPEPDSSASSPSPAETPGPGARKQAPESRLEERRAMVDLVSRYSPEHRVKDRRVLDAMLAVPRHEFVPAEAAADAYGDHPLAIGDGQTISQPFIVGVMTEALELGPFDRVLEIGTGSGYQAAVLSRLAREVYSVEIVPALAARAAAALKRLGYANVHVKAGDGYLGWPEHAPFDAIIATCAPKRVPQPLVDQLKVGGRLVIPVGAELFVLRKTPGGVTREKRMDVRFVPMTGKASE